LSKDTAENKLEEQIIQTIRERQPETVDQLITMLKEESSLSDRQVLKQIERLQGEGKIHLKPASSAQTFTAYMRSTHVAWYWITLAITALTIAAVYTIPPEVYPQAYLRNVVALIFTLWLPGYTFIKALFPKQLPNKTTDKSLDTIERIALSVGMSLALVPMVGLLLNYTPWGINTIPSTLSLAALTLAFATAALIREHETTTAKRTTQQNAP
jgi:hypothetical protein